MGFQETFNERVMPASNRAFGMEVTLKHGAGETAAFTATWSNLQYEIVSNEGFSTLFVGRSWDFPATVATIGGTAFEPRAGDRICVTENGVACEFELLPVADQPAAELLPGGYRYRVRTKRVA